MNVKSIEKEGSKAKIVIEIDEPQMNKGLDKAYQSARKNIQLPGFRKGKAPRKMIESVYGAHVFYEDAINEIFPEVYDSAVKDGNLKVVGTPSVTDMHIEENNSVTLTVETELYPEVKLGQYKGLEVERPEVNVTEDQINAELNRMAQNVASIEHVERAAETGDTVNIDFEGFDNGVPFEGGKGENHDLKLGSNSFVPGFEEQLVGMTAGEEKDINITFPENYTPELAGKPVVFHVKINSVSVEKVPAIDDEFAKDVSEFDTVADLRNSISEKLRADQEASVQSAFENAAVERAAAAMEATIPGCMVDEEAEHQLERFAYQFQSSGMSNADFQRMFGGDKKKMLDMMRPGAEKSVRNNVLINAVIEAENITVTDEEMEEEYASMAKQYDMTVEKVKSLVHDENMKDELKARKAAKLIADSAVAVAPKAAEEKKEAAEQE